MNLDDILTVLQSIDQKLSSMMVSGNAVILLSDARRQLNAVYVDIRREVDSHESKESNSSLSSESENGVS